MTTDAEARYDARIAAALEQFKIDEDAHAYDAECAAARAELYESAG